MTTQTPIYTATAGPADPKAPLAAKAYTVVSGLLGLVAVASTFGVITAEQGAALGGLGTAATGLVGAAITAVAAFRTNKQVKNGTFDPAPPPVIVAPIDAPLENLVQLQKAANDAVDQVQAKVADGLNFIQAAASIIPGGAPANVGTLLPGLTELADLMRTRPAPQVPHPAPPAS
ncbi:holin [Mycobacterium phage Imvubu]|uniref:Holin n=1 Tax=Mycobacterium phage Imvubu TaxID=2686233 RepID=A0A6B9LDU3_9CAUD|nr:holin [Mycobacterium phage Imvubu]QHB37781.1 holin [Mycobacterium phage Imvubu]